MNKRAPSRWNVLLIFFVFMLLHQTDRLLIGPLKGPISGDFQISNTQFGMVISGALVVGTILYPIWGYLYDRFARSKLLALTSSIWGSTTWLSAIAWGQGFFFFMGAMAFINGDIQTLRDQMAERAAHEKELHV